MMKTSPRQWPQTDAASRVLFFAQAADELISARTFESWRVYTLDTIHRLVEAIEFADEIQSGKKIDKVAFEPVIQELLWSMHADPVVEAIAKKELQELERQEKNNYSLNEKRNTIEFLYLYMRNKYKEKLEEIIVDSVSSGDLVGIRKSCGYYLSYLLNCGYSREYIDDCVQGVFFSGDVRRAGSALVKKFISRFSLDRRRYEVAMGLSRDFGIFLEGLGYTVGSVANAASDIKSCIEKNSNSENLKDFVVFEQVALDEHAAVALATQEVSALRAYAYLGPAGLHAEWGGTSYVKLRYGRKGRDLAPPKPSVFKLFDPNGSPTGRADRAKAQAQIVKTINRNFDEASANRINSALTTATLAVGSGRSESQMISIWSAIEVLLSDPVDGARIVHYTANMVPAVCMYHARRQFHATSNDLKVLFRGRYTDILDELPSREISYKPAYALAACVLLDEHADTRSRLLKLCDEQPIARHRIDRLSAHYLNIGWTHKALRDHEARVGWQVNRIYRSRNLLVHAGKSPDCVGQLIQNADEYFRFLVTAVLMETFGRTASVSIEGVIHSIKTRYNIRMQTFKRGNQQARHDADSLDFLLAI